MGKAAPSPGMLVALVLVMLVSSWTEGRVLNKCELKSQLEEAFAQQQGVTPPNVLAKLVCTVETISKFDTSLVTVSNTDPPSGRSPNIPGSDNPSAGNPIDQVDREQKEEVETPGGSIGEGSGEQPEEKPEEVSGDFSGQNGQVPDLSGEGPLYTDPGFGEGSGDQIETTLMPVITPFYPIDESLYLDIQAESGDLTSTPLYPIDETLYPDSDVKEASGDDFETPTPTTTPAIIADDNFGEWSGEESGQESGEGSGQGSGQGSKTSPYILKRYRRFQHTDNPQDNNRFLYGIFQLSDDVACQSNSGIRSLNLCGLDCSALTDDDITDDIACLMTLNKNVMERSFAESCQTVKAANYFASCD